MQASADLIRLNWGCGPFTSPGWINADVRPAPGVDVLVQTGAALPLSDASVDLIVGMHVLQDFAYPDVVPALRELHRVLRPGGWLRLGLPDLDRAIRAYQAHEAGYFYIPDRDARSIGAKFVTQMIWYGSVRTPFNEDFGRESLRTAGFGEVLRCEFGRTASGRPALCTLDNRPRESLFLEASK